MLCAAGQMDAGERPIDEPFQVGNVHLSKVKVDGEGAVGAGDCTGVDDGQPELGSQIGIDTTLEREPVSTRAGSRTSGKSTLLDPPGWNFLS